MSAEVHVQPLRLATSPFGRRPKLFMFFQLFMVHFLFFTSRTIDLALAYGDSSFINMHPVG